MNDYKEGKDCLMMVPGPTSVPASVLEAMAQPCTSPDIDDTFIDLYEGISEKLKTFLATTRDVLIIGAEGILGLEGACASLFEPGDRVLCVSNGPFGSGFASFVSMFGATPVLLEQPWREPVDPSAVEDFLKNDNDFVGATIIHCETPTGILNPVEEICPILKKHGILTVVDAVSSIGAHKVCTDEWGIDMIIGASQKCFSAPAGVTFLSVSQDCWNKMDSRKTPVSAYYGNLSLYRQWKEKRWFPYTMPWHLMNAFSEALSLVVDESDVYERHHRIASATRKALRTGGIEVYPLSGFSNSVTPVCLPQGMSSEEFLTLMKKRYNLLLGGSIGIDSKHRVVRIGHMGDNCYEDKVATALRLFGKGLEEKGFHPAVDLEKTFTDNL